MIPSRIILLAFGANLPFDGATPVKTIQRAVNSFPKVNLALPRLSRLYRSPCFPIGAGPDYVNAAALLQVEHSISAETVLERLHSLEVMFGRQRAERWGRRTLDIDLLAYGDLVLPDLETQSKWRNLDQTSQMRDTPDRLILPHPRLQDRAFVLKPLADVAPAWRHPVLGLTVSEMLSARPDAESLQVQPI